MTIIILSAIVLAIALGYFTRINIGIFAMIFAYLIGAFLMDLPNKKIIAAWPISIFFVIFAVSLFYNFATLNGTLEVLANKLISRFKNARNLLAYVIFFISTIIAAMGAGFYSVLCFMAPISFALCDKTGLNKIAAAMAINYGALAGANFVSSQSGIIFRGLMQQAGVGADEAFFNAFIIFLATFILPLFVLFVFRFAPQKASTQTIEITNTTFNKEQKITLFLMIFMMILILIFPLLHLIFPQNHTLSLINKKIDIAFIALIFVAIALFLKLADEKKAIALVPWGTLIMICGVGLLISIAIKAGVIDGLAGFVKSNVNSTFLPLVMMLIGAAMSLFSSTLGVVTPALFPIVPNLAASTGVSEVVLFTAIVVGAQASAISPFSSGGSIVLGACKDSDKDMLFKGLISKAIPLGLCAAFLAVIIVMNIF